MIHGKGGLTAYLGTNDMITIASRAEAGEEPWQSVLNAMIYTIAKQIGAMYVALLGKVDVIILTGGIAHNRYCVDRLTKQIDYLAPIFVRPGEGEMESLAFNALGALTGKLELKEYV